MLGGKFRLRHYLLLLMLFLGYLAWDVQRLRLNAARDALAHTEADLRELKRHLNMAVQPAEVVKAAYGDPPVPIRPPIPKRLGGEFYRGNCERDPELFNGGNYRTATLRVALCDEQRRQLQVGDDLPSGGMWIMFEVLRSPHTADALFTDEYLKAVFLSRSVYDGNKFRPQTDQACPLEVLEPSQHWVAYYPIGAPVAGDQDAAEQAGLVYVYWGMIRGQGARGTVHYGIPYELKFVDGKIAAGSDLWLGSLFWTPALARPQPGKVPLDEWLDYRPIPEISGENSSDPNLLGVPEHERRLEEQRRLKSGR